MFIRICAGLLALLALTGCAAFASQLDREMAPRISTEVAMQVGTAIAEQSAALTEDGSGQSEDEIGPVTRVVDGDTIDVLLAGKSARVRYLQMNTPERDHPCYREATQANADLVAGETVRLVADTELVDRYGRLLRFIYVGDTLVNRVLVEQGFAEVVLYPPNDAHYDEFVELEKQAAAAARGCHPSGIFDDGSYTR